MSWPPSLLHESRENGPLWHSRLRARLRALRRAYGCGPAGPQPLPLPLRVLLLPGPGWHVWVRSGDPGAGLSSLSADRCWIWGAGLTGTPSQLS